jgi:hypothetical protein
MMGFSCHKLSKELIRTLIDFMEFEKVLASQKSRTATDIVQYGIEYVWDAVPP